jgi:fatty-acyl-CoA synthase
VPLRSGEPMFVAPPFFHGFGFAYLALGLFLGSPVVTRRRFDAEATLTAIDRHRVRSLVAVPVMLQRIMDLPPESRRRHAASSLRAVICGAGALTGELSSAFMDAFGDVVYNLYGSTETGFGAIADPSDLRAAPGTVGRPPLGATVKILDDDGREAPTGHTGRIFVGGDLVFEGYSEGGSKDTVDGLMSTGDLGHQDREGRLFIDGREDEMIVSGGENVFPQEVEEVLAGHGDVADVAVLGVTDEEFGQALKAWVVRQPGRDPSVEALRAHVKANLARYKVPREIAFVSELPRNPTGKVVRSRLEQA